MLELAIKHEYNLQRTYQEYISEPEYAHYNRNGYTDLALTIEKDNWSKIQFVSVKYDAYGDPTIVGFLEADRTNATYNATISAIHFGYKSRSNMVTFGKDLRDFIDYLLVYKKLNKIEIACRSNNSSLKAYSRLIPKAGGRLVGVKTQDTKNEDGTISDLYLFEITAKAYKYNKMKKDLKDTSMNIVKGYFRKHAPATGGLADGVKRLEPEYHSVSPEFYENMKKIGTVVRREAADILDEIPNIPQEFLLHVSPDKPPLGIMPKYIWNEKRIQTINEAIERYSVAGLSIPFEWTTELAELLNK